MADKIQVSHPIIRPTDEVLIERLQRKYRDYQERMGEYSHPELQLYQKADIFFKAYILNTVLTEGQAELSSLVEKLQNDFPEAFKIEKSHFLDAWLVIWDYCANAGTNTVNTLTGKPGLVE